MLRSEQIKFVPVLLNSFSSIRQLRCAWRVPFRVENFVIFGKLVFVITSRILRILMERIKPKDSTDSKL